MGVQVVPAVVVVQQGGQVQVEVEDADAGVGGCQPHQQLGGAVHQAAGQVQAVLPFALGGGGDAVQVLGGQPGEDGIGFVTALACSRSRMVVSGASSTLSVAAASCGGVSIFIPLLLPTKSGGSRSKGRMKVEWCLLRSS